MKNFDSYLKQRLINNIPYILPDINGYRTFSEFCELNNFTDETITEDAINCFYLYNENDNINRYKINYKDLIYEGLKSYDSDKLISKLQHEFKADIKNIEYMTSNENSKCVPLVIELKFNNNIIDDTTFDKHNNWTYLSNNSLKETDIANKFKDIIKFYGYYISLTTKELGLYYIYLEPETTRNVFDDVLKDGGYIYHVTRKDLLPMIKKRGLVPKAGKKENEGGYRYFPERIYFVRHNKNLTELKQSLKSVINDKQLNNDYVILKISLKQHNIGLYIDKAYNHSNNVYTYESIPIGIIDIITDINKL